MKKWVTMISVIVVLYCCFNLLCSYLSTRKVEVPPELESWVTEHRDVLTDVTWLTDNGFVFQDWDESYYRNFDTIPPNQVACVELKANIYPTNQNEGELVVTGTKESVHFRTINVLLFWTDPVYVRYTYVFKCGEDTVAKFTVDMDQPELENADTIQQRLIAQLP